MGEKKPSRTQGNGTRDSTKFSFDYESAKGLLIRFGVVGLQSRWQLLLSIAQMENYA